MSSAQQGTQTRGHVECHHDRAPSTRGSDFAALSRRIAGAGLLARRPGYYIARIVLVAVALAGGWSAFFALGDTWWQLVVAVVLAVLFAQVALVDHDLAHRQVFRTRRPSEIAGRIVGNLGIGMSYGWWMDKHTRHHANPNHEDLDPDVSPDILVCSERQASEAGGLTRIIGSRQAFLFFPLMDVARGGLNYQIEHHLFPNMPTPNLRRAKPIVEAYCAELGVGYQETGLVESYRIALRHMHDVGEPLRARAT